MEIAGVDFFDQSKKIVFGNSGGVLLGMFKREYLYSELESYEYIENNGTITKGGSGIGRALVGGALFGSTGAIIGAATRKQSLVNVVENMDVRMTFRVGGVIKTEKVRLLESSTRYGSRAYEKSLTTVRQLMDKLDRISQMKQPEAAAVPEAPNIPEKKIERQTVDIKAKLTELKDLYDQGLIDEEEYKAAKKEVLSADGGISRSVPVEDNSVLLNTDSGSANINNAETSREKVKKPPLSDSELAALSEYIWDHFDWDTQIKAIIYYREQTGAGIAEAKDKVEKILREKNNASAIKESSAAASDMEDAPAETKQNVQPDSPEMDSDAVGSPSGEALKPEWIICPSCEKKLKRDAKFCVFCGTKIEEKIPCPSCGKLVSKTAKFCNYCGETIIIKEDEK